MLSDKNRLAFSFPLFLSSLILGGKEGASRSIILQVRSCKVWLPSFFRPARGIDDERPGREFFTLFLFHLQSTTTKTFPKIQKFLCLHHDIVNLGRNHLYQERISVRIFLIETKLGPFSASLPNP